MSSYCAGNRWRTRQLMMAADSDPTGFAEAAINREREVQGLPPYRCARPGRHPWSIVVLLLLSLSLIVAALVARDITPASPVTVTTTVTTPATPAGEPHSAEQVSIFDGFLPPPAGIP
jgi:hypothetical protein